MSLTAAAASDSAAFAGQSATTPLPQIQQAAAKLAGDEAALGGQLQQQQWSASVKPAIDALVGTFAPVVALFQQCSTAASGPAVQQLLTQNQAVLAAQATASAHVRALLGLPTSPTASGSAAPTGSTSA